PGLPASMEITWTTINETEESTVEYGLGLTALFRARTTDFLWTGSEGREIHIHGVTLTVLRPASAYVYHCGSEAGWSDVLSFTALNESASWGSRFAIYGDMGNENPHIYDLILNFISTNTVYYADNGRIGDEFMRQIQSIAVYVPYMTYCTLHTYEIYLFLDYGVDLIFKRYEWLKKDLEIKLGNRAECLWITTMGHRSMYSSNNNKDDTCYLSVCLSALAQVRLGRNDTKPAAPGLEDVLFSYQLLKCLFPGLDLELWAQEHTYERLWTVYGYKVTKAPVHVITGSTVRARSRAAISVGAISNPRDWSAFCNTDNGHTCMHVHNTTHLYLEQVSDDQYGKVINSIWVVKEKHGFSAWF
uniref:Acid phosphatase 7, tartrate resistant (putative) n=1 Tax=Salmo trutta TaxID=8032 RepID=A0A674BB08_SALTR